MVVGSEFKLVDQMKENFAFRILLFCIVAPQDPVSR